MKARQVITFSASRRLRSGGKPTVNKTRNPSRFGVEGKWSPQRPVGCPGSSTWTQEHIE